MIDVETILQECAAEILKREKSILSDCFEIGKQLLKARDTLREWGGDDREGRWLSWLKNDVKMSPAQADRYFHVYEKYGDEKSQFTDVGDLGFKVSFYALAILAAPHADPVAVAEVEKEIREGKKLTLVEIQKRVPSLKPNSKGKKSKQQKRLKPKPIAPEDSFLIGLYEEIQRKRKEANDVRGRNKQWTHHGINIAKISMILDWIMKTLDEKIQELTRAAS